MESRTKLHNETKKPTVKQESIPDMEDSPPVSDSDVSVQDFQCSRELTKVISFQTLLGA